MEQKIAHPGLVCSCKSIEPFMLQSIESDIHRTPGQFEEKNELMAKLYDIAKQCGYEKDEREGWIQFPKQCKALQSLGTQYEIIKEHDDGDLTIRIPEHNALAVITTEGEIFTKPV